MLTQKNRKEFYIAHCSDKNYYTLTNSIVEKLNKNTKDVCDKGLDYYIQTWREIDSLDGELSSLIGKKLKRYSIITNKNLWTFSESSTHEPEQW